MNETIEGHILCYNFENLDYYNSEEFWGIRKHMYSKHTNITHVSFYMYEFSRTNSSLNDAGVIVQ